jgi:hypothetical protein
VILGDGSSTAFNVGIGRWNGSTNAAGAGGVGYFSQGVSNSGGHYFYTGDAAAGSQTERARIPPAGGFQSVTTISVGNATPSASGAGITFPATQSASSDANTLDDYEEGTWTPTITYSTPGTLAVTYTSQAGTYTKVGNLVTLSFGIRLSAFVKGTASGDLQVGGVPFTQGFDTAIGTVGLYNSSFSSQPILVPGASIFTLLRMVNNGAWVSLDDPDSNAQYFGSITIKV